MCERYRGILRSAENGVESILTYQVNDRLSRDFGGWLTPRYRYVDPPSTLYQACHLITLYHNRDSFFYQDIKLYDSILRMLDYLERVKRSDGNLDSLCTNFDSAPDTAFCMQSLATAYWIALRYRFEDEKSRTLLERLYNMVEQFGHGIVLGGFHTPNHRWVNAAALAMAYRITGAEAFRKMADRYLAEGIDCDEEGEYTERSPGVYNAINNRALIILAELLDRADLLEHVKRNLDMMFHYYEPDGSIFTQNSTRQDKSRSSADTRYYPVNYYDVYRYMAYRFKDGRYMAMVNRIEQNSHKWGVPGALILYMLKPEWMEFGMDEEALPASFDMFYEKSGIVRIRREGISITLLKDQSSFLHFQAGSLQVYLKLCASFFAVAQFKAQEIQRIPDGYLLKYRCRGNYRMPFEEAPKTQDWWEMDHSRREVVNPLFLEYSVAVKEIEDGVSVHISTCGCDRVPAKLEVCVSAGCRAEGDGFCVDGGAGAGIEVSKGDIILSKGADRVLIGPAFLNHTYATDMRGSEPQSSNEFTIYFTEFTNFEKQIDIKKV